jgi:protein phosphatase
MREVNEDRCLAAVEQGLLMVADGMGGEYAGGRAAELIVELLPGLLREHLAQLPDPSSHRIELALKDASLELNQRMRQASASLETMRKMGATLALVLVRGADAHVAHMGDSRIYGVRGGRMERLTHDHSVVSVLVRRGAITRAQARSHPMRGRLSRYVGMGGSTAADVRTVPWQPGDRLALCSDGLTDGLTDEQIQKILAAHGDLLPACHALVDAANKANGRDNITVLLAENTS